MTKKQWVDLVCTLGIVIVSLAATVLIIFPAMLQAEMMDDPEAEIVLLAVLVQAWFGEAIRAGLRWVLRRLP